METSSAMEELLQIKCYTCSSREMNLIKSEIFRTIRTIRSVRRYQESLWWKLPVLLSSCLKDFPNDNGNDGFRGFHGNFQFLPQFMPLVLLFFFVCIVFLLLLLSVSYLVQAVVFAVDVCVFLLFMFFSLAPLSYSSGYISSELLPLTKNNAFTFGGWCNHCLASLGRFF